MQLIKIYVENRITEVNMMLKQQVESNLKELKLDGVLTALNRQLSSSDYENESFLSRVDDLISEQHTEATNKRVAVLQRQAKLRWEHASLSQIDYKLQPSLKQEMINELAQLDWVKNHRHIILSGPAGAGKTYLACALGQEAIMQKIPVLFCRHNELLLKLVAAEKEGKFEQFRKKLNKFHVLIIDDWGVSPLNAAQRHLLFELVESRDQNSSLLITSQYDIENWHDAFQDPTVADSVLDRIVHNAYIINQNEDSLRKAFGIKGVK
jgi:DNA replication protein DnaC